MKGITLILVSFVVCFSFGTAFDERTNGFWPHRSYEVCPVNKAEENWIEEWIVTEMREKDGWGEQTHRAVIALFVSNRDKWSTHYLTPFIINQLEVELTKALYTNSTSAKLPASNLALYIHALIAVGMNPRNFHGIDLVARLEFIVSDEPRPHPLAVLALYNAGVTEISYLHKIRYSLLANDRTSKHTELQAIAIKAVLCANDAGLNIGAILQEVKFAVKHLIEKQERDGNFGNIYTTAHATQALVVSNEVTVWSKDRAFSYLTSRMAENVNILSAYCIILALNSGNVRFIKDLSRQPEPLLTHDGFATLAALRRRPKSHYVSMSIAERQDEYFSVTMKSPLDASLFDIMRLVANSSDKFRFSYALDQRGHPSIYSISGKPNDPHTGRYWCLIEESAINHDRHTSMYREKVETSSLILPHEHYHYKYSYLTNYTGEEEQSMARIRYQVHEVEIKQL